MTDALKQRFGYWLMLAWIFLAGASAGGLGYALSWMLGDVGMFPMGCANATGDQITREIEQWLMPVESDLKALAIIFHDSALQPHADDRHGRIQTSRLRADDRQCRALVCEQISDPNLDLSQVVAQRHKDSGAGWGITQRQFPFIDPSTDDPSFERNVTAPAPLRIIAPAIIRSAPTVRSSPYSPQTEGGPLGQRRDRTSHDTCSVAVGAGTTKERSMPTQEQRRFVRIVGAACSGPELEAYLDANPLGVTRLLAHIFIGNRMSQSEREIVGLQMGYSSDRPTISSRVNAAALTNTNTIPAMKPNQNIALIVTRSRSPRTVIPEPGSPANGGLPRRQRA